MHLTSFRAQSRFQPRSCRHCPWSSTSGMRTTAPARAARLESARTMRARRARARALALCPSHPPLRRWREQLTALRLAPCAPREPRRRPSKAQRDSTRWGAPDSHAARCARLRWLCGAGSERAAFAPQDLGAAACQLRRRASAVKVAAARRSQAATASSALLLEARADHRPPRPPPSRERNLIPPLHSLPTAAASTPPPAAPRAT